MGQYYSLKKILAKDAQYNVIYGMRGNGKTYAVLKHGLERYWKNGEQLAIVRRWGDDFKGKRGQVMFDALVANGEITKITGGEWNSIYYFSSRWYLCRYEGDKRIVDETPLAYGFAITSMEHDKSTSYPGVTSILFDEFLTRTTYVPDEFVLFMNVISTIIRNRDNVKIFMCGNTVTKYCPYFKEMGLTHIKDQKKGTIDVYRYGDSELKVAVEYCSKSSVGKRSEVYFAFDNPKLSMITGGEWELGIYPHCPVKYKPKDVVYKYYIVFDGETLECEVVYTEEGDFTFIHRKTTPLQDNPEDLIFTTDFSHKPNHKRIITRPLSNIEKRIADHYKRDKVFYSDNEVGEVVRSYLQWCGKEMSQ